VFSEELKSAIQICSGQFAGDIEVESDEDFAAVLAEVTLDAGRLGLAGYVEEQKELAGLIETKSWSEVCSEAALIVCY